MAGLVQDHGEKGANRSKSLRLGHYNPGQKKRLLVCAMQFKDTRLVSTPELAGVPSANASITIGDYLAIKEV